MKRIDRHLLGSFAGAWVAASVFFVGLYLVIHFFNQIVGIVFDDDLDRVQHGQHAGGTLVQVLAQAVFE